MFRTKTFVVPVAISVLAGCSYLTACGSDDELQSTFSTDDAGSTGGSSNGGSGTGGRAATGGRVATGGRAATGGRSASGGSATGGAQNTGGSNTGGAQNTGGASTGGAQNTGGASTGGAQNTGGASTGGAQNTGGASTGGAQNTGGASTGGAQNTGGVGPDASAGGNGGTGTGGASTGGASTGGGGGAGGNPEGGLCGNGALDPGEECDPPSAKFCTASCKLGGTCTQCENDSCGTVVTDCTQGTDADLCIAALQCARENDCYRFDPANCYCGTVDFVSCQTGSTPADGPCVDEYKAAASSATPAQLLLDLTDPTTALGRAGFIMQCDIALCNPSNGSTACWAQ